jgi:class 3 adenylate cyclase/tetratricopeptide (TPR) repeat protein
MSAARRERKVVTVVFCDLVGFTSQAESLDPEDVEALLTPYHERLRTELEQRGGTVEKFIGDAVMALFGAPTAHEDDAERAVRACLAIRDWAIAEDDVQVRIAATTGEALIRLDARPEAGEGMAAGDVVNTAARLQSAAPVNGILVDEATHRATRRVIDYREAAPVEAKGKAAPITVWEAVAAHSRFGVDIAHSARTELVGRERELAILRDAFDRARHERLSQLVTLVGVPGLGKSRLVYELRRIAEDDPELITWRQGHCLAYGDGVTMWALGEIVKAQAGVLETDSPDAVADKIHRAVADVLPTSNDAGWIEAQLLTLVGQSAESELGGDRRGQAFAAWRGFLEALAVERPLVLVLEDLHWADDSMLDFVDQLVEWVTDVPLLVVGTARPELLVRRPAWGGGKLNATTIALSPLSDEQTAALIGGLIGRPMLADAQRTLLENAGGNPLYAEQFADLYLERGSADELPLPETLQGVIAARLDGLTPEEKSLLQDAAVVGKVFWSGSLGRDRDEAASTLHALERKGFVRRQRQSSLEDESEYAFGHALVRDVAYGQIPRAERAAKHRAVAAWIESLGRPEDHAEMLVHHVVAALELERATGREDAELVTLARRSSAIAGDRAAALNAFATAATHYERALELSGAEDDVPELLFKRALARFTAGDDQAVDALEEARDALLVAGDRTAAAETEALLGRLNWLHGAQDDVFSHLEAAEKLIEGESGSLGVARVLSWSARQHMLAGNRERGLRQAEEALALAEELQLDEIRIHALTTIGSAREFLSDPTGRDYLRAAIELARSLDSPLITGALNNLSVVLDGFDLAETVELEREALSQAERFGDREMHRFLRGNLVVTLWLRGEWDVAMTMASAFISECEAGSPHILESPTLVTRGAIELARGNRDSALADLARGLELARTKAAAEDLQTILRALSLNAWARLGLGDVAQARAFFEEAVELFGRDPHARPWTLTEVAFELGQSGAIRDTIGRITPSPGRDASLALLDGDMETAARLYAEIGFTHFEIEARLRWAEQLAAEGRVEAAHEQLERALAFYRSVGATLFVERAERLLAQEATG